MKIGSCERAYFKGEPIFNLPGGGGGRIYGLQSGESNAIHREVALITWSSLILMGGKHFFTPLMGWAKHFLASFRGGGARIFLH